MTFNKQKLLEIMDIDDNIVLDVDSYKASHWLQYPPGTQKVFSYIESRGGKYEKTVFFGLQIFLKKYLSNPITKEMVDQAEMFFKFHGEPFNREGWDYIVDELEGNLPVIIKAVPEGTLVPFKNALVTIENTDTNVPWITSYLETALHRAVWYPVTVASNSYNTKQVIKKYMLQTADNLDGLEFMLHDFGARGVSSKESAGIGGAAHLVNFKGTDTVTGITYAMKYYNADMAGFSIPAAEHSSITTWGKAGEVDAYRNMIIQFDGYPAIAVVSDSYDIYNAVKHIWGEQLKSLVEQSESMIVVRPDSGHPATVVRKIINILREKYGVTKNTKGYDVLNNVRVIQGDGVNVDSITEILESIINDGFSAENVVFGQGGALLQQLDRDTNKFAMKASWALINDEPIDVYKDPITDPGKVSKKGRLMLYRTSKNEWFTDVENLSKWNDYPVTPMLTTVYNNGKIVKEYSFEEVRTNVNNG